MDKEENKIIGETVVSEAVQAAPVKDGLSGAQAPKEFKKAPFAFSRERTKNSRKSSGREPRAKPEFDQKLINIRRVAIVVS